LRPHNRCNRCRADIKVTKPLPKTTAAVPLIVQTCDGRLKHLCPNISYGKVKHPQGKHLHQQRGGGGHRHADTFRDEQARQRAEPHDHRMQPLSIVPSFRGVHTFSSWHTFVAPRGDVQGHHCYRYATPNGVRAATTIEGHRTENVEPGTQIENRKSFIYSRTNPDKNGTAAGHPRRHNPPRCAG